MTTTVEVELVTMTCGECGVIYGMCRTQYDHCKAHGTGFFCTHGHSRIFRESDVQRLTRELAKKDQQLAAKVQEIATTREERDKAQRSVTAQKAVVTRLKNKAARGECPCCGKLFADLHEHMKAEHPDFEQQPEAQENQP
jgi:hypothetical protein